MTKIEKLFNRISWSQITSLWKLFLNKERYRKRDFLQLVLFFFGIAHNYYSSFGAHKEDLFLELSVSA